MSSPTETKVVAGAAGSGAGAALGTFTLWLLGVTVWHVPNTADKAGDAIGAVPTPVAALLLLVVSAFGSYLAGYLAPHSFRPAPTPAAVVDVPPAHVGEHEV